MNRHFSYSTFHGNLHCPYFFQDLLLIFYVDINGSKYQRQGIIGIAQASVYNLIASSSKDSSKALHRERERYCERTKNYITKFQMDYHVVISNIYNHYFWFNAAFASATTIIFIKR